MARFIRFTYVNEKHLLNLEHVVNVIRVEREPAVTYVNLVNGVNEEYYGDEATDLWDALSGLDVVDRKAGVITRDVTSRNKDVRPKYPDDICICGHPYCLHNLYGQNCYECSCSLFEEAWK